MSNRRIATMDIVELVRLLRAGEGDRALTERVGLNRRTVAKYRVWAAAQGFLEGPMPKSGLVHRQLAQTMPPALPPQQTSTVGTYRDEIAELRQRGMEIAAIRVRLEERHGHPVSYGAVWRFVRRLEPAKPPEAMVRVEVQPGSQAQVDFGYAGRTLDPATGRPRKTWVFVLVLAWSRHLYAELVFDQRVETWLGCHQHAFAALGGVPKSVVLDNLKAGIVRACAHEPVAQRSYRECAEHYGFMIDPNPPRSPHLKGKVEQGGVHYVTRNFLAGREPTERIDDLNRGLWRWAAEVAGQRVHGTTQARPLDRFQAVEQAALLPLPSTPYDPATWAQLRVGRDCHLTFARAHYSVPFRLNGQRVWVRGGRRTIEVYTEDHALVTTHDRAEPGAWRTVLDHLPPEKVPGLAISRETCGQQAHEMGAATAELVNQLLDHRPEDRLRSAGRLLALAATVGPERLERACARALHFGEASFVTVKRILAEGLDREPPVGTVGAIPVPVALSAGTHPAPDAEAMPLRTFAFVRPADEFAQSLELVR